MKKTCACCGKEWTQIPKNARILNENDPMDGAYFECNGLLFCRDSVVECDSTMFIPKTKMMPMAQETKDDSRVSFMAYAAIMVLAALTLVGVSTLTGCSTARTKWTDPTLRIAIDPSGIEAKHYAKIQNALHRNGRFIVVDRGQGFDAILKEQQLEHKDMSDRFVDTEKYAIWARVLGIGSVVIAHADCTVKDGWFSHNFPVCSEYLAIVDARTGQVLATAEGEAKGDSYDYMDRAPSWDDVVDQLADNFPKNYEPNKDHQMLRDYKALAGEEAQRMREKNARDLAGKKE